MKRPVTRILVALLISVLLLNAFPAALMEGQPEDAVSAQVQDSVEELVFELGGEPEVLAGIPEEGTPEVVAPAPEDPGDIAPAPEDPEVITPPVPEDPEVIAFELPSSMKLSIAAGETFQLVVDAEVKSYASSKAKVATVSEAGLVTAVAPGKAKITVTLADKKKRVLTLTVLDPATPIGVEIADAATQIPVAGTVQLKAVLTALDGKSEASTKLSWKSSNKKVATVDKNGLVTGKKDGTAVITVTTSNKLKASVEVTVIDVHKPTAIAFDPASVKPIAVGGTVQLNAVMTAVDTPVSKLTWKSSNKKVATVDKNGLVTGKKEGTATITVTTENKLSASIDITVDNAYVEPQNTDFENAFLAAGGIENPLIRYQSINASRVIYSMDSSADAIEAALSELGFGGFAPIYYGDSGYAGQVSFDAAHKAACIFAYDDIQNPDGTQTRVFAVICRGTHEKEEWISNFTVGTGPLHYGFDTAARGLAQAFKIYWENNLGPAEVADYKVWITGHSRGAAVANVLAGAYLPEMGLSEAQIYAYTFACPFVTLGKAAQKSYIFNYNFGGDLIPRFPFAASGFGRFGKTYELDHANDIAGIAVSSKKGADNLASVMGYLSDNEVLMLVEGIRQQLLATEGALTHDKLIGTIVSACFTAVNGKLGLIENPTLQDQFMIIAKILDVPANVTDITQFLTMIINTHPADTYQAWISSIGDTRLL